MSGLPSLQTPLAIAAAALFLLFTGLAFAIPSLLRQQRLSSRLRSLPSPMAAASSKVHLSATLLSVIGNKLLRSGFIGGKTRAELEQTLARAGYHGKGAIGIFVAAKLGGLLLGIVLTTALFFYFHFSRVFLVLGLASAGLGGLLTPDLVISRLHKRYLKALERGLPDALDLMVICTQAGLSLEPSLERVAIEIAPAHPAIAREFSIAVNELRIASDIRAALLAFGNRVGFIGLRRLATTLVQTIQYGMPLSHSLKVLASEMRQEMLTRFEARAARLSVLLTVPMIVFILPCIFLVVGGPAMIQLLKVMGH
jgi:tight adherence protein C